MRNFVELILAHIMSSISFYEALICYLSYPLTILVMVD
jgi:hypothetical protein